MIGSAKTSGNASIRHNNFDLIRLLAASQVVLFHGMEHLGPQGASHSMVGQLLSWFPGVPIFFVVSGFLVSLSFERAPAVGEYFRNRALRIFPALWVCLVFALATVLLFGMPLRSSPGPVQFAGWWAAQMSVVQFYNPDFLRGYGVGVLNGSLWTIPVELQYYAVLPLLYLLVKAFKGARAAWLVLAIAALAMSIAITSWSSVRTGSMAARLAYVSLAPYLYLFLLGLLLQRGFASAARWLDGKGLHWLAMYLVACLVGKDVGWNVGNNDAHPVLAMLLGVTTISLAFTARHLSEQLLAGNDISYGTYIYHMPIVNACIALGLEGGARWVMLTLLITYVLAFCSWRLVEMPFLRRKHAALRPAGAADA
jgi:peptidoglycan/LPS O-acetylase OafA/YrhL